MAQVTHLRQYKHIPKPAHPHDAVAAPKVFPNAAAKAEHDAAELAWHAALAAHPTDHRQAIQHAKAAARNRAFKL